MDYKPVVTTQMSDPPSSNGSPGDSVSPSPPASAPPPAFRLYSVGSITLATALGTPVAGGILMALNYRRLGQLQSAKKALLWTGGFTILLFILAFVLPDRFGHGMAAGSLIGMYKLAKSMLGAAVTAHRSAGGRIASAWGAFGIGLACLTVVLLCIFTAVFLLPDELGTRYEVSSREEIYYRDGATEADAKALGQELQGCGYFDGSTGSSVVLAKPKGRYAVYFCVGPGAWDHPEVIQEFDKIGRVLAEGRFGRPLTLRLCDESFTVKRTLDVP